MSPQSLAEGPSFRLQPSHLGPTEEELPPPPDEPVGFPERGVHRYGPRAGASGRSPGVVGTGTAGTTGIPPAPSSVTGLGVVHRLYFYRLNLFSFSTKIHVKVIISITKFAMIAKTPGISFHYLIF